jgi:hypothetical protein
MGKIIQVIIWGPRKVWNYTKAINTALEAPTGIKAGVNSGLEWTSKLVGSTTGAAGLAKGTVDAAEALVCQDGVCFVVSCIGVGADALQIIASMVPGPNVTALVTTPVSVSCKVFVHCCKKSMLPWGGC